MNPYPYVSHSDAYVMTSFNEGFPNALVEAMSLGLPAIASDCRSGPREILAPDTDFRKKAAGVEYAPFGILVPECSGNRAAGGEPEPAEQDLAEAMVRLIEDGRMREAYRRKSMERAGQFSKDLALQQWERLICDSAEKNAGSGQGRQI
jgi:glycosyltransferase involved in cell wall biosynthesis